MRVTPDWRITNGKLTKDPAPRSIFRLLLSAPLLLLLFMLLDLAGAQSLQVVNMAIPSKSFQMAIYPIAQQKGYMKEEGIDQRVIFIAPTTSIQAMLGGDAHFTGAGSSALVSIARAQYAAKGRGRDQRPGAAMGRYPPRYHQP